MSSSFLHTSHSSSFCLLSSLSYAASETWNSFRAEKKQSLPWPYFSPSTPTDQVGAGKKRSDFLEILHVHRCKCTKNEQGHINIMLISKFSPDFLPFRLSSPSSAPFFVLDEVDAALDSVNVRT